MIGLLRRFRKRKLFDSEYVGQERRKTRAILFIFLWALVISWLIKSFVFSLAVVEGKSMYPTLAEGDYYLVNQYIYNFIAPERKDVVAIKSIWLMNEEHLIKRIIGTPGDIIKIEMGKVHINGELLEEPYVKGETRPDMGPFRVKADTYFVMGDNRERSIDSRSLGCIEKNKIRGKISPGKLFTSR